MSITVTKYQNNILDNFNLPFILQSNREFTIFWKVVEHFKTRVDLLSPEILSYCEKEIIHKLIKSGDYCLSIVLDECLKQIEKYLKNSGKRFQLGAYLYNPPEVPEFEGITILANVEMDSFNERISI